MMEQMTVSTHDNYTNCSEENNSVSIASSNAEDDKCPHQELPKQLPEDQLLHLWKFLCDHNLQSSDGGGALDSSSLKDCPKKEERNWPSYDKVMADVAFTDYTEVLQCPFDVRKKRSSSSAKNQKTLCPYGAVCCAKMELFPQPKAMEHPSYTGLLTPGKTLENCILRLSSAIVPPSESFSSSPLGKVALAAAGKELKDAKIFPCAALKVFRADGIRSGNLLFAGRKVGQPEDDFFAHVVCTQLTEKVSTPLKPFVKTFYRYAKNPLSLGISDFCSHNVDGIPANTNINQNNDTDKKNNDDIQFPFSVILNPIYHFQEQPSKKERMAKKNESFQEKKDNESEKPFDSFLDDLLTIPKGTAIYDIFACPDPLSVVDPTKLQRIGRISTSSEMILSKPDDTLFFRHQKKEEDFEYRPKWREQVKQICSCDGGKTKGTVDKMAGWRLFESQIAKNQYVDFEQS